MMRGYRDSQVVAAFAASYLQVSFEQAFVAGLAQRKDQA
jgi:hypothetical protein